MCRIVFLRLLEICCLENFTDFRYPCLCFRVVCKCGSCGSEKQQLSEWERHTGSKVKNWKTSIRVKGSMLTLEQWVCVSILGLQIFLVVTHVAEMYLLCKLACTVVLETNAWTTILGGSVYL